MATSVKEAEQIIRSNPELAKAVSVVNRIPDDLLLFSTTINPNYRPSDFHRIVAEHLEAVADGEIRRLMIFAPPRHGKTQLASINFPAWWLGKNPNKKIIHASYNDSFSKELGEHIRDIVRNPVFQASFPDVQLKYGSESKSHWKTINEGQYLAVGRGGQATGYGAHLLILDDLIKNYEEAYSETIKQSIYNWYNTTLYSRLEQNAAIVFINTRWTYDDLPGRLLEEEPEKWTVLSFPALFEEDTYYGEYEFKEGTTLWPEAYPLDDILDKKQREGDHFYALYQQDPLKGKGNLIQKDWWIPVPKQQLPMKYDIKQQFWDTGYKDKKDSSYSACTTWIRNDNGYYLIDAWWDKLEFYDLKDAFLDLYHKHKPDGVTVEDQASGTSLIQEMRRGSRIPVVEFKPDKSKEARIISTQPMFRAEQVYILDGQPWTRDVIEACAKFPQTHLKDIVDTISMALNYLRDANTFKPRTITPDRLSLNRGRKRKSIFEREREGR